MMTTTEKNKLIAEFMGAKVTDLKGMQKPIYYPIMGKSVFENKIKYHSSWDWLMPVIEKILDISLNLDTMEMYYNITDSIPNIEQAYNACVEFILWYNQNQS